MNSDAASRSVRSETYPCDNPNTLYSREGAQIHKTFIFNNLQLTVHIFSSLPSIFLWSRGGDHISPHEACAIANGEEGGAGFNSTRRRVFFRFFNKWLGNSPFLEILPGKRIKSGLFEAGNKYRDRTKRTKKGGITPSLLENGPNPPDAAGQLNPMYDANVHYFL